MLTQSISPEDVKNVEVRLDEKNAKLKESLLDATEYVVLDIKLKDELKKSLFGKIRGTAGYQTQAKPGGYLNAFSLKRKEKIHLFAEHDAFAEQTISLDQIRNIGAEAFQKLFEIPADFQTLTERRAFNDEIFGFKDYTIAQKDILGVSTKLTISPSLDIYLGTYNSYSKDGKGRSYQQEFTDFEFSTNFLETRNIEDYSSKNKLDIRFDKDKLKARLDINAVFFDNEFNSENIEGIQNQHLNYRFENRHQSQSFYENLLFEYKISNKTGVQFKASYATIISDHFKELNHNNPAYSTIFTDEQNRTIFDFIQLSDTEANNFLSEIAVHSRGKPGAVNFGLYYQSKEQVTGKEAFNNEAQSNNRVLEFTGQQSLNVSKWGPFLGHEIELGKITFDNEARWLYLKYPDQEFNQTSNNFFEYKSGINYSPGGFDNISVSFSRRISSFPLEKLIPGSEISDFQSVLIPGLADIDPQPEMTLDLSGAKKIQSLNLLFDPWIIYGQSKSANRFLFSSSGIISIAYDQLKAEYLALTFPISKNFKKIPLKFILEPEWLINQSQNRDNTGNFYNIRTTRALMGLKLNTIFDDKPYDFFIYPKYSAFIFTSELSETRTTQEMLSLNLSVRLDLYDEKLLLTPNIRTVKFLGNINSSFTNVSMQVSYSTTRFRWVLSIDNLLDDSNFVRQTIYPTYFASERNFVFDRYVKIGLEYKFK